MQNIKSILERVVRWDASTELTVSAQGARQSRRPALSRLDSLASNVNYRFNNFVRTISPALEYAYLAVRAVIMVILFSPFMLLIVLGIALDYLWGYPTKRYYG